MKYFYLILLCLITSIHLFGQTDYKVYSAVPTYAKSIYFSDEFEDNTNEWTIVPYLSDDVRESKIKKGEYRLTSYDKDELVVEVMSGFGYTDLNDFEIEVAIKHNDFQRSHANGLIWGMSPDTNNAYGIAFNADGEYHIQELFDGQENDLVPWTYNAAILKDDFNKLTVRKIEEWYYLFINEQFVYMFPFEELELEDDVTGFFAEGTSIAIDYIKITEVVTDKIRTAPPTPTRVATQPTNNTRALVRTETTTAAVHTNGEYYALIIGVQDYTDNSVADLRFPIRDATRFHDILVRKYGFTDNHIIFLKNPTRSEVFKAFNTLRTNVKSTDNLLIFYAGHGYYDQKVNEGYWLPSDAVEGDDSGWIANSSLSTKLKGIDSKHTLLISDACFGGSIFKPSRSAFANAEKSITTYYEKKSRKGMTSGTLKTVPDESVFAKYLMKTLEENTKQYLSSSSLFHSFNEAVANNSLNAPQYGVLFGVGDEGGQFIFIQK
ncbi:caspase family protein [Flammeovirga pectinis]|uniref:Caspase family protein n=1 Tax=Flammeovirga pectinis TaxID=2494373 RepID=A0A3S9P9V4_9BACT|nr:caspase family protein [Flammeovirga pectinis]AZQ64986.1 caspase family protein [Flammeovirga pectinis]